MSEEYSFSSEEFINFSVQAPLTTYTESINGRTWEYRQSVANDSKEIVIIIPGIYENANTSYKIATKLINDGYKVLILPIPNYDTINEVMSGFDAITSTKHIFKAHIIGVDFGGFVSLFLYNSKFISCEIASITLINSFVLSTKYKRTINFFSPGSRSDLITELALKAIPPHLKSSVEFVIANLNNVSSDVVKARIKCRQNLQKAPIPADGEKIMILQATDWAFKLDSNDRPNHAIPNATVTKIEKGGFFPHLANADETYEHVHNHIMKWKFDPPE